MFSTQIDTGVIGGSMIDMELLGVMIGNWMLALESGKPPAIEPSSGYIRPMFNWTQIERWHLSTARLPAESVFINRPLTLWGQYKAEVVSAMLLILILSAMTIALIIQNRRRKFAEMSARETAAQLAAERDLLEQRVNERTANLSEVNDRLQQTNKELVKEITERKRAAEAFRAIFENNSAAMAIIEKDTTISMVNDEYCKMSLYDKENLIGTSWTTQIPPEDLERLKEYNRKRLINPESAPGKYEFSFYRKDGEIRHSLMSIAMIQSTQKIICSFVDITDRKRAEDALRESEEKFSKAFQTSPYAITITHAADGKFIDVNNAFTTIVGFTREEALADSSIGLKLWGDEEDRIRMVSVLKEDRGVSGLEFSFRKKNGAIITGLFSAQVFQLENELCILSSINDITERKLAEAVLEEERRRLQQALDEVRTLRGIVPICASCKNIRDDKGFWNQVEKYVSEHTEAEFSHGICPDCAKKLYPELYK